MRPTRCAGRRTGPSPRPCRAGPVDRFLIPKSREQLDLLLEKCFVVGEIEPEQRKGFGERTAAQDDLGTAVGHRVEGGKALEDAHRIIAAQDRHRGAEVDVPGATGNRGQHDIRRRDSEVGPVMLTDAEPVHTQLVGQHRLRHDISNHLRLTQRLTGRARRDIAERVQTELELGTHFASKVAVMLLHDMSTKTAANHSRPRSGRRASNPAPLATPPGPSRVGPALRPAPLAAPPRSLPRPTSRPDLPARHPARPPSPTAQPARPARPPGPPRGGVDIRVVHEQQHTTGARRRRGTSAGARHGRSWCAAPRGIARPSQHCAQ